MLHESSVPWQAARRGEDATNASDGARRKGRFAVTHRALLQAAILACGLVVVAGCKTNTAADANWKPEVVLSKGMEPHDPLRYQLVPGSKATSTMLVSIPSSKTTTSTAEAFTNEPGFRFVVSSGPVMKLPNGNVRIEVTIREAEAIVPRGMDAEEARGYQMSASLLKSVGGWIEVDDRGVVRQSELNQAAMNPDLPVRLLMMIVQARSSLARVVFPEGPVGLRGRWEARKTVNAFGFEIRQVDRYTLTQSSNGVLGLRVEIAESAPTQTVRFEESRTRFELESLSVQARGDLVVRLDTLEASGRVEGRATERLSVRRGGKWERVEHDSAFRIDIEVESERPSTP